MASPWTPDRSQDSDALASVMERPEVDAPRWYAVILFNDDYTPMPFVVGILVEIFSLAPDEALRLAQAIHAKGQGQVGPYTRDVAETRTTLGLQWARQEGHPLRLETCPFAG